ncbi:DUF2254 domain-containing protein [Kamptonema cortianum]|uniref:DUF2254 domain-containing protein n=1 Tax=Geitlerinema calcuttense NRMC-F 0142 TaxID=2922238 RepID=A0ABT7LYD0_9CYAN|nr:DUF2254 domain-containing protein [Geitlerinema calcuttense]MDK3162063.1 DUF2254 domain-containing protein [Kamptonema cortianum]MDL5056567.1 DUF2254 domain-containing protein [Geitlerinema calcuttense NRMC-F 0142]
MNKSRLQPLWEALRASYWFVPTLMAAGAVALAFAMLQFDRMTQSDEFDGLNWVYAGGPEGARTVLSTIASSMMAIAGTTFSIVIVALTLAASQFGPRLLRNFMGDTGNQVVLGTYIATFIYCLMVLRSVRGSDYDVFVPQTSVTVGILLSLLSIGVLIYFFHHVSTSIQASQVVGEVNRDLKQAIERLFPKKVGRNDRPQHQEAHIPIDFEVKAQPLIALNSGYLQVVDDRQLMKTARDRDLLICLQCHPGDFIVRGRSLAKVWSPQPLEEAVCEQIQQAFILGKQRTKAQDIEFSINQLVEIALRAISPSVNDPFTAIQCIDQLSIALSDLAERQFPSPYRYDEQDCLRLIAQPIQFAELVKTAFTQIRQYGRSDVAVSIRLLEAIATIITHAHHQSDRQALLRQARMIIRGSQEGTFEQFDRNDLQERYQRVLAALDTLPKGS